MRAASRLAHIAVALCLGACSSLPWGEGASEPTRATVGAVVRVFDQDDLYRASDKLMEALGDRWVGAAELEAGSDAFIIDWKDLTLTFGAPRLELVPAPVANPSPAAGSELGLLVHIPFDGVEHEIELSGDALDFPCTVRLAIAPGELDIPVALTADKLGRMQGGMLPGASVRALSDLTPNAFLDADFTTCLGATDPGVQLARLGEAFANAAARAVGDSLSAEVPAVLGLSMAFGWSAAVNADALGTGFARTVLRADSDRIERRDGYVQVAYALTVEADPHPCVAGIGELPTPRPEVTIDELPPGAALHLRSLERIVAAAWLTGSACADHVGRIAITAESLAPVWPELASLGDGAEVTLELWPAALPRVSPDRELSNGLYLETGRMRVDVMVSFEGARWRGASIEMALGVSGALWADEEGRVLLEPAAVEALPVAVEGGLLGPPMPEAVEALIAPLVEALLVDRPLAQLPPQLTPIEAGWMTLAGDYLAWPVQ